MLILRCVGCQQVFTAQSESEEGGNQCPRCRESQIPTAAVCDDNSPESFTPSADADPIEQLRQFIRHRLRQGATQSEIEDELIKQGLEPSYAINLVCSVRTTGLSDASGGRGGEFEGMGYIDNRYGATKERMARRQSKLHRAPAVEASEPNPELDFGTDTAPGKDLARLRSHQSRQLLMVIGFVTLALVGIVVYILFR